MTKEEMRRRRAVSAFYAIALRSWSIENALMEYNITIADIKMVMREVEDKCDDYTKQRIGSGA